MMYGNPYRAICLLENSTLRNGAHFDTSLIWKEGNMKLPNSLKMAENRLLSLESKFNYDNCLEVAYVRAVEESEEKGYSTKPVADEFK